MDNTIIDKILDDTILKTKKVPLLENIIENSELQTNQINDILNDTSMKTHKRFVLFKIIDKYPLNKEQIDKTYVYMEKRMGCGLGGCKSCAVKTLEGYKLVCTDGPIFPLKEVKLD